VFAFSKNDIWFSDGAELIHYNGAVFKQDCSINLLLTGKINKIWGTSDNDLYVVGDNGLIVHYDGRQWQRIESGTDLPIQDIWGNNEQILVIASNHHYLGRELILIKQKTTKKLDSNGLFYGFGGIWFIRDREYLIVGDGIFIKHSLNESIWFRYPVGQIASYYSQSIRGLNFNDIVIVGDFNDISHFNGYNWKEYKNLYNAQGQLVSVNMIKNLVVAVGNEYINGINDKGIIILGKR
ncbi:MAG: glucosyl transferase, partial [Calditrichaeota bacterium]